jgi:light-regulated signal transduction histidine kinase (bacteriophytochrome)
LLRTRSRFNRDYRIVRQNDGLERWVSGLGELEMNDEGRPIRLIGTIQDITERKMAEAQIRRMNEELERRVKERTAQLEIANQELEAFSYSVSHDLRGPLRGIDGFSRALLDDYQDRMDESGKHYLNRIQSGAQRMGQLIDDILKLSRINRSELDRMEIDLSQMCGKILENLAREAPDRTMEIAVQPGLTVQADRRLMLVALENMLGNAWKFTSRCERPRIEVNETTSPEGDRILFIRDNGAGFDMQYVGKIFDAFQRLHSTDEFEGTGIGLAIVQRIIHRHGGRIWAEAEIERGATFFFTLPERGMA